MMFEERREEEEPYAVYTVLNQSARVFGWLENNPNLIPALHRNRELARAVDVIMAWEKRIYILMIKVNKLIFWFKPRYFLNEIRRLQAFTRATLNDIA